MQTDDADSIIFILCIVFGLFVLGAAILLLAQTIVKQKQTITPETKTEQSQTWYD